MNILVFSCLIGGHNLEYIHHLYNVAEVDQKNRYIFVLPQSFLDIKDKFEWRPLSNVDYDFFKDNKFLENPSTTFQMLSNSLCICKTLGKYANKYDVDVIYSNHMIVFVPFAPFYFRRAKIVGIIYRIYLHEMDVLSKKQLFLDKLKFYIMSFFNVYKHVLILNDEESAITLNHYFHAHKFSYLPDPYLPLVSENYIDIRKELGINNKNTLFVHFGAMNINKGTLEILESIIQLPNEVRNKYSFVFAGRVGDDIRERFYEIFELIKDKMQVILIDKYCSYHFFSSLCVSCDAILTPYKRTSQSSGLIGYASQFNKPVIAPQKGLLGNLVKKYNLGILVEDCSPKSLILAYKKIADGIFPKPSSKYCEDNSVEAFNKYMLRYLND